VLPTLAIAPAPFAAAFAGTIDALPSTTTDTILAIARSLGRHGVTRLAIANAHHDPAHVNAIKTAAFQATQPGDASIVFPDLTRRRWAEQLTDEFQLGACHAGRYETSIVLAERPELVDLDAMRALEPNRHSLVDAIARGCRTFEQANGPLAYFGWPAEATAEEGRTTVETLGRILEESVVECLTES
jgi:creatinine amidohydrolase